MISKRQKLAFLLGAITIFVSIVFVYFGRPILEDVTKRFVVLELTRRFKAQVDFSNLELTLFPPRLLVEGIQIKKTEGPLHYIGVQRASIEPGIGPIFLGQISIKKVEIERPSLRIDLTDETPTQVSQKQPGRFRIPTATDLLKLKIDEISIHQASLALKLPGEDMRIHVGAGKASYEGRGEEEEWSWKGAGIIYRGERHLGLDKVSILAHRLRNDIRIDQFQIEGLGTTISLQGKAYPEADLFLQVRGTLEPIEKALSDLGVLSKPLELHGTVGAEGRVTGPWDSIKWYGEFRGADLQILKRKIQRMAFSFRVRRRTVEAASGEIIIGDAPIRFSVGSISPRKLGNFQLTAEKVPYEFIQRAIDPHPDPKLHGPVNVVVQGKLGFDPWYLKGQYQVTTEELQLVLPPHTRPYLPFIFRDVNVTGDVGWARERGFFLENGLIKADGVEGNYKFEFPGGPSVHALWNAKVTKISSVFTKDNPLEGSGNVGGGLEAGHGFYRALLDIRLDQMKYGARSPARCDGQIIFEKGNTVLKDLRIVQGDHSFTQVNAIIPNEDLQPLRLSGSFSNFDLGWIADVAARRFTALKGVHGIGSGKITLSGLSDHLDGTIRVESKNLTFRSQTLSNLDVLLDLERGDMIFQKARFEGDGFFGSATGVIGKNQFRNFHGTLSKLPISAISVPTFLNPFVSSLDATFSINGPIDNPNLQGNLKLLRHFSEGNRYVAFGGGQFEGELADLSWALLLDDGTFRAKGRFNAKSKVFFEGSGNFSGFSLSHFLPSTTSSMSGQWKLTGDFNDQKTWLGNIHLDSISVKKGEWNISLGSPADIFFEKGFIHFSRLMLSGPSTDIKLEGALNSEGRLSGAAEGHIALRILTLFPLGIDRTDGDAQLKVHLGGSADLPKVTGTFSISNGLLQFKGFPHPIESLSVSATLDQSRMFFDRIEANIANGKLRSSGELGFGRSTEKMTIAVNGEIDHVSFKLPSWLPSIFSGSLSLVGPITKPLLSGELVVHQARYQDDWDWKSKILTFRRQVRVSRVHRSDEENIRFNLHFRSEGNSFYLKNNLATATLRGDLRLTGSDQALGLLGKIEMMEGKVVFLDNAFQLTSGIVSFDREDSIHASFDLNARTRVAQTDILLDIRTEHDEVVAFLTSQPPKDETNIIALLTLGVDADELISSGSDTTASILPGVLSAPVQSRLETGLKKVHLVDTLQFVPYFSEDTKTTGLKMVVGKELLPKVRLLYSTDLFEAGGENTVKLEQSFNKNLSLQGSFRDNKLEADQEYDLGLDFEFKFEF